MSIAKVKKEEILSYYFQHHGNIKRVAEKFGVGTSTLTRWINIVRRKNRNIERIRDEAAHLANSTQAKKDIATTQANDAEEKMNTPQTKVPTKVPSNRNEQYTHAVVKLILLEIPDAELTEMCTRYTEITLGPMFPGKFKDLLTNFGYVRVCTWTRKK